MTSLTAYKKRTLLLIIGKKNEAIKNLAVNVNHNLVSRMREVYSELG